MVLFDGYKSAIRGYSGPARKTIHSMLKQHQKLDGGISVIFVSDDFLLDMNRKVLKHDYYTDIITFDYTDGSTISGELYISTDRVRDNALKFKADFHVELLRVIFHGVLHLLGYKDKNKSDIKLMRKQEDRFITLCLEMFHGEP